MASIVVQLREKLNQIVPEGVSEDEVRKLFIEILLRYWEPSFQPGFYVLKTDNVDYVSCQVDFSPISRTLEVSVFGYPMRREGLRGKFRLKLEGDEITLLCPNCGSVEVVKPGGLTTEWREVYSCTVSKQAINTGEILVEGFFPLETLTYAPGSTIAELTHKSTFHTSCDTYFEGYLIKDFSLMVKDRELKLGRYWKEHKDELKQYVL